MQCNMKTPYIKQLSTPNRSVNRMEEFAHFKAINSQLKKKFVLKKPDLNETKEQFNELSKELKSFKSYSGLCSLAAGKQTE